MIAKQRMELQGEVLNLEEQAIALVGRDIYEKLIKGYTEKQWGRDCKDLPSFIIRRLPLRFRYDNNYFNDPYQGIPKNGYTQMILNILDGIEVLYGENYLTKPEFWQKQAKYIVYTGAIDEFYRYQYGNLEYRSLRFETKVLAEENYQGGAVMNYTDRETPFTRIIEHKHFAFFESPTTVVTWEYPEEWKVGMDAYYPINNAKNSILYSQYRALADKEENLIFGGRLGEYKYYDMWQVVRNALDRTKNLLIY